MWSRFFVALENCLHKFGFIRKLVQTLGTSLHNQAVISKVVQTLKKNDREEASRSVFLIIPVQLGILKCGHVDFEQIRWYLDR